MLATWIYETMFGVDLRGEPLLTSRMIYDFQRKDTARKSLRPERLTLGDISSLMSSDYNVGNLTHYVQTRAAYSLRIERFERVDSLVHIQFLILHCRIYLFKLFCKINIL